MGGCMHVCALTYTPSDLVPDYEPTSKCLDNVLIELSDTVYQIGLGWGSIGRALPCHSQSLPFGPQHRMNWAW